MQPLNWGSTPWIVDKNLEDCLIGKIMECSRPVKEKFDLTVQVQLPDEWDQSLGIQNIGVSAFVETDICSSKWIECCNNMSEIIVPSTFTKNVAKRSGIIMKNIEVIPEWFNTSITHKTDKTNFNFLKKFNFLILGQLTGNSSDNDRKNIENMIKWFCQEFNGDENVGLILKTNSGRCSLADRKITTERVKKIVKSVRKGKYPVVEILHGNMSKEEISNLHKDNKVKAIISATRGEGYGLPLVDSAAAGNPVVVPNWSGHMEFLEEENICSLNYKLKEIPKSRIDERIFIKGSRWAEVESEDFKCKIRQVFQEYKSYKKKAQRMQTNIRSNFSREAVFEKYDQFFKKYLG